MKRLFVMATMVALLGLPLTVWADPDEHYQYFQPAPCKANSVRSAEKGAKEAVSTSGEEIDSAAKKDAEKPRESGRNNLTPLW